MLKNLRNSCLVAICALLIWGGFYFQQAKGVNNQPQVIHTISRLSFGIKPQQTVTIKEGGIDNYLQAQLNPGAIAEADALNQQLAQFDLIKADPLELWQNFLEYSRKINPKDNSEVTPEEKNQLQKEQNQYKNEIVKQARQAHIARAILSSHQLEEIMTDFWFNHFNVFATKRSVGVWIADYENQLRSNALGKFRDLLTVTAHHPAMLLYLDNDLNTDPNSKQKYGNARGLNENYARELMELHTLGVDGGYTQQDVIALARILTGWSINYNPSPKENSGFRFHPKRHDSRDKVFLGQTIQGGGIEEGEKALDILATHPATAHFISYKLAQYFVSDRPPERLVKDLAQTFLRSEGDIKIVLNRLFHSPEFNDSKYYNAKFTTPFQYLVSVVRVSNIQKPNLERIDNMLRQLGMPVFACLTPDGYENTEEAWLSPNGILNRISYAVNIANGSLSDQQPIEAAKLRNALGNRLTPKTKQAIAKYPPRLKSALILASPEMMYR